MINIGVWDFIVILIPKSNKVLLYLEPSGRVHSLLPLTVQYRSHSEAAGPTPPLLPPRTVGAGSSLPQTCSSGSTIHYITSRLKQILNIIFSSKSNKYWTICLLLRFWFDYSTCRYNWEETSIASSLHTFTICLLLSFDTRNK